MTTTDRLAQIGEWVLTLVQDDGTAPSLRFSVRTEVTEEDMRKWCEEHGSVYLHRVDSTRDILVFSETGLIAVIRGSRKVR